MCLRFVEMGSRVARNTTTSTMYAMEPFFLGAWPLVVCRTVVMLRPFWSGATSASGLLFGLDEAPPRSPSTANMTRCRRTVRRRSHQTCLA